MAKIMLVEDDNNLREIYEARLLAEGHEIISAHDGEEALAIAVREKPELIISDVMMPKISGFDMLDILRSSPETKNTKVIMMTALSQLEDKDRADRLGADRYLVKSQVTLEDVINVANEVLSGPKETTPTEPEPIAPIRGSDDAQQAPVAPVVDPPTSPVTPAPPATSDSPTEDANPAPSVPPATASPATDPTAPTPEPSTLPGTTATAVPAPAAEEPTSDPATTPPAQETPAAPSEPSTAPEVAPQPAPEPEATPTPVTAPAPQEPNSISIDADGQILNNAQTANAEQGKVEEQINSFINSNPTGEPVAAPDPEAPIITADEAPAAPAPPEDTSPVAVPDGFIAEPTPESAPAAPSEPSTAPEVAPQPAPEPEATPPATEQAPENPEANEESSSPSMPKKIIQPLGDPLATPDLKALVAKEEEKEQVQKILTDADLNTAPQPAPEQPRQKPDDPNAIAL